MRDLSLNLRPATLDDFGLVDTFAWYVERQAQISALNIEFFYDDLPCRQSSTVETTCFRVVQEALTNVMRHAEASNVRVELRCKGPELRLTVQDDGQGFTVGDLHQNSGKCLGPGWYARTG